MDFSVNDVEVGTNASEVKLTGSGMVHARLKASAYLHPPVPDSAAADQEPSWMAPLNNLWSAASADTASSTSIHDRPMNQEPYWHIERARIRGTREVPVELVMNGKPIAHKNIIADGSVQDLAFDVPIERSSWVAIRILGSSHTNPIFILVDGKPIRASRGSAEWCLAAVNQCWTQKAPKISKDELPDAQTAYDHARDVYTELIKECEQ